MASLLMFGLVSAPSKLQWFGNTVKSFVDNKIDAKMRQTGELIVARARALAPVDTGYLRSTIGYTYRQSDKTLMIHVDASYGLFQEFGTRFIKPHPYIRPAMNSVGRVWGVSMEMNFAAPGSGIWQGLYAHQAGFAMPSGHQPKPLTQKQIAHVRRHLMPMSKMLYRGNVRRAKLRVRRVG
jgi:HK97 gp10 family phage protein